MALVVETGAGVVGANTYASVAFAQAYASERGISALSDSLVCEQLLLKAMDYIESRADKFIGQPVNRSQSLAFPRYYVVINGHEYPSTELPRQLLVAQVHLAIEAAAGDLEVRNGAGIVVEESVPGAVKVRYAAGPGVPTVQRRTSDNYLVPLMHGSTASGYAGLPLFRS